MIADIFFNIIEFTGCEKTLLNVALLNKSYAKDLLDRYYKNVVVKNMFTEVSKRVGRTLSSCSLHTFTNHHSSLKILERKIGELCKLNEKRNLKINKFLLNIEFSCFPTFSRNWIYYSAVKEKFTINKNYGIEKILLGKPGFVKVDDIYFCIILSEIYYVANSSVKLIFTICQENMPESYYKELYYKKVTIHKNLFVPYYMMKNIYFSTETFSLRIMSVENYCSERGKNGTILHKEKKNFDIENVFLLPNLKNLKIQITNNMKIENKKEDSKNEYYKIQYLSLFNTHKLFSEEIINKAKNLKSLVLRKSFYDLTLLKFKFLKKLSFDCCLNLSITKQFMTNFPLLSELDIKFRKTKTKENKVVLLEKDCFANNTHLKSISMENIELCTFPIFKGIEYLSLNNNIISFLPDEVEKNIFKDCPDMKYLNVSKLFFICDEDLIHLKNLNTLIIDDCISDQLTINCLKNMTKIKTISMINCFQIKKESIEEFIFKKENISKIDYPSDDSNYFTFDGKKIKICFSKSSYYENFMMSMNLKLKKDYLKKLLKYSAKLEIAKTRKEDTIEYLRNKIDDKMKLKVSEAVEKKETDKMKLEVSEAVEKKETDNKEILNLERKINIVKSSIELLNPRIEKIEKLIEKSNKNNTSTWLKENELENIKEKMKNSFLRKEKQKKNSFKKRKTNEKFF